jgi:hypothetical protein
MTITTCSTATSTSGGSCFTRKRHRGSRGSGRSRRGCRSTRMIAATRRRGYARGRDGGVQVGVGARSLSVVYSVQCGNLEDDFSVASSRRNWSLPMGTYLHSQRSRVHWTSGKWGTVLPEYSTPNCASTASQASRPGKMRTARNNPSLCAFLSARIERAICDGVLRIPRYYQAPRTNTLEHAISA